MYRFYIEKNMGLSTGIRSMR